MAAALALPGVDFLRPAQAREQLHESRNFGGAPWLQEPLLRDTVIAARALQIFLRPLPSLPHRGSGRARTERPAGRLHIGR